MLTNRLTKERWVVIQSLLFNAVVPFLVYSIFKPHVGELHALMLSAASPCIDVMVQWITNRKLDPLGTFMIIALLLGVVLVSLGGNPKWLLIRESLLTGLLGLAAVVSLFLPRPLAYYLIRIADRSKSKDGVSAVAEAWDDCEFRRLARQLTYLWGIGFLVEFGVRTFLVFRLTVPHFLLISPWVQYGLVAMIFYASWRLVKRVQMGSIASDADGDEM